VDLPRSFVIRESSHRVLNPVTPEKIATLGAAIGLRRDVSVLDLCCGKGEMLSTWARDHGITGVGVDISTAFLAAAHARAEELEVADRVSFIHGDASTYVADGPVDVAACIGATWIGNGPAGTIELLARSLRPGGLMLIGEPFWRADPPENAAIPGHHIQATFETLPGLVTLFSDLEYDLVEMVLADEDSWDRYRAAQWFNIRTFLDANPDDELAAELRAELTRAPLDYIRHERHRLGWGVFALMKR
jgi:SAM-dependent methyltransferase